MPYAAGKGQIPLLAEQRFAVAEKIVRRAEQYGIPKEDIFVDCLTLTASAQQKEVVEPLKAMKMVKEKLGVKTASIDLEAGALSGGNQQKVVIAKWIGMNPSIIIMDEPTRGIDVGAKRDIYDLMNELTSQGVAIIMVSSELPEVIGMSDRILVIHEGKIAGELDHEEATQEKIITLAAIILSFIRQ